MRAPGDHRQRLLRALSVLALSAGLVSSTGCAKRLQLSPAEFERIDKREQAVEALRVYVSKRLVVLYEADDRGASYEVDKTINTSQDRQLLRIIVGRSTMGQIIDSEDRNGAPLLWVTYSSRCKDKDCAYGFVQTEDGVFRLAVLPARDGYREPKAYFKRESKPLTLGKLKSLAEKNNVYLFKKKNGKVRTIDLIVKKRTDNKRQVDTIRDGGVR
ncbi:hypothetical protein [Enhygromyxa salina]|nr:hypothetical protein [Enhygromyxa salina]